MLINIYNNSYIYINNLLGFNRKKNKMTTACYKTILNKKINYIYEVHA